MIAQPRGFTLIEILVVVAIVAVISAAALLSVNIAGGDRAAEREARRLAELTRLACERASSTGRDYGLHAGQASYGFSRAQGGKWLLENGGELRTRDLPGAFALTLESEGHPVRLEESLSEKPVAICAASGELSAFRAQVAASRDIAYEVRGEVDGALSVARVAAAP